MDGSILDTIGSPLVRLDAPAGATIAAKVESANPGGSVKVRPALEMVEAAEREGHIQPGDTLVEATSGNTGIGLALVAAVKDYDLTVLMPGSVSEERRQLVRAYEATVELVEEGMEAANELAATMAAEADTHQISQFDNPANPRAHERTTAPEIIDAVGDRTVDVFVAAVGTGGTISGTARRLLEEYPDMTVVGVEPVDNPFLSTGTTGEHDFQGMGPDFIPDTLDRDVIDEVESVAVERAEAECRRLAEAAGILAGQSSGAAAVVARRVAERHVPASDAGGFAPGGGDEQDTGVSGSGGGSASGSSSDDGESEFLVVTLLPDTGERYLSTGLFS